MSILDNINRRNDIHYVSPKDYAPLAEEIREFILDKVSVHGGHLASNLGSVELTMALHLCMVFPQDKLIFDVGHQSYTHKILTGRRKEFDNLREFGGISGFPKSCESDSDAFNTGHSSTSISAALGYATARELRKENYRVAAVIGDGSLTGGMAYEALNSLSELKGSCLIILNDNEMSIDKNVGGFSKYLNNIRVGESYNEFKQNVENSLSHSKAGAKLAKTLKKSKDSIKHLVIPETYLSQFGITYIGPIDGHDVAGMVETFENAFKLNKPILVHVKTTKGKGYRHAEKHPDYFHGIAPFDLATGKVKVEKVTHTYTDIFAKKLVSLGKENKDIVAITAAMSKGTGVAVFKKEFPNRTFDVGIAEQHAVTFAAGLAKAGMLPFVAIYSSFLQRAYDQILHDVCLQNLHVIFGVDRSGIVGADGETHQGIYDISYLSHMPNLEVLAPKNRYELESMMDYAIKAKCPIAIKYSRGTASKEFQDKLEPIVSGKSEILNSGSKIAIFAVGNMCEEADKLRTLIRETGINATVVNVRFVNTVDSELVSDLAANHDIFVTMEENVTKGGYGEAFASTLFSFGIDKKFNYINASINKEILTHGSIDELRKLSGIDAENIYERIKELL